MVNEGTVVRMPRAPRRKPAPETSPEVRPAQPVTGAAFGDDWWRRGVVYQVYPRSFADSNDDGIGDLPGLIEKLDYLNDGTERSLGIDAIWLSPIHPSPGFDVGYDVADYDAIDPLYGTLDDFDRLVAEAHRRGIRIMLDLVMNHTSSAHRWFEESRRDPAGPFGDWYLWRDGTRDRFGRLHPPNNWTSFFGGSAWTWDETRGQFYLHTFLPEQPDLNWRNPAVRAAMLTMVRGWLERGVDGFRLDVFNAFFKHADLPSNPRRIPRPAAVRPAGPPLRQGPAGAGRLPGRVPRSRRFVPGADDRRRAVLVRSEAGGRAERARATSSSTSN